VAESRRVQTLSTTGTVVTEAAVCTSAFWARSGATPTTSRLSWVCSDQTRAYARSSVSSRTNGVKTIANFGGFNDSIAGTDDALWATQHTRVRPLATSNIVPRDAGKPSRVIGVGIPAVQVAAGNGQVWLLGYDNQPGVVGQIAPRASRSPGHRPQQLVRSAHRRRQGGLSSRPHDLNAHSHCRDVTALSRVVLYAVPMPPTRSVRRERSL
jgi:hypothetical protein